MQAINKEIKALINKVSKKNYRRNYTIQNPNLVPPVNLEINGELFTLTLSTISERATDHPTFKPRKIEVDKEFQRKILLAMGWKLCQ